MTFHNGVSSLHRQSGRSPYWYCAYRTADGNQHFKSTGTTSKAEAKVICEKMASGAKLARRRRLSPEKARRIIESAVAEMLEEGGHVLPHSTIEAFLTSWLNEKKSAGAESTHERYAGIVEKFLAFLGPRKEDSLASVTKGDVLTFRDDLAKDVTPGTVNTYLKVLRVAFGRAVKEEIIERNPAALVDRMKAHQKHERRAFTMEELSRLLAVAGAEWQTMIMVGLYTGLRMQDAANLTWTNIDLEQRELVTGTRKTKRTQILPLARPLLRHIQKIPRPIEDAPADNILKLKGDSSPSADEIAARKKAEMETPLCPGLRGKGSGWLSNQFHELMASAGLVAGRGHQAKRNRMGERLVEKGKGRSKRRLLNEISFHALRHTATSLLKNAGVSGPVAQDIIGHESEAMSRNYTHFDSATKREALDKLPDVTTWTKGLL